MSRLTGTTFSIGSDPTTTGDEPSETRPRAMRRRSTRGASARQAHRLVCRAGSDRPGSFSGTFVGGQRLDSTTRRRLQVGDTITIDDVQITLELSSDKWYLQAIGPATKEIELTDSPFTIGHSEDNDYCDAQDNALAPYHAQIIQAPERDRGG